MIRGLVSRIALLASWLGVMAAPAQAADFAGFNAAYARDVVAPAFKALAGETKKLAEAADDFGAQPSQDGFAALRVAYDAVSDAWMQAQFFRLGPLGAQQRSERFEYWPEKRPIIDKQLAGLLANAKPDSLDLEKFAQASVAVQGLPALERLLYGDTARQVLSAGPEQKARIAVIKAIAHNLDRLAQQLAAEWEKVLSDPKTAASPFTQDPNEAAAQLYAGLMTGLQIVSDQKIAGPRGPTIDKAKPKSAEQWRAGRSLKNIKLNLQGLREATVGKSGFATLLGADQAALKTEISTAFDAALAAADAAPEPLDAAVTDAEGRKKVGALLVAVNHLRDLMKQKVPPAIGISLGFNELDGDGS
ncbi:imelysin family protein [Dongia sedimenti]|uniref:Imelysin family protein n=1 Tax=Dongia sedimenti TaxID=3064282 RepID=A0ABU0YT28_9PROT|nr:imelysin family protein [Rhodospirillaceae bacterium R-7]